MTDPFTITIAFIVLTTIIGAFIARRKKDICIRDFQSYTITLEKDDGEVIKGLLNVQPTGLEIIHNEKHEIEGRIESTYLLYKFEYKKILALVRYQDELSDENRKRREKDLYKTYHPGFFRRLKRSFFNFLKTFRDSVLEVINISLASFKKTAPLNGTLTDQDKYVNKMKTDMVDSVGTAYEPLLEKYIGHKVVFEFIKGKKLFNYSGFLKEYSSEYIEIMDVDYFVSESETKKADLVLQRNLAIIRHLGE